MMPSARDFIEAIECSLDEGDYWWEQFDSYEEALEAINCAERDARRLRIDEHTIAILAAAADLEVDEDILLRKFYAYIEELKDQLTQSR
jgi:hypothetical protein